MSRTSAQRGDPSAWGRADREIEIGKVDGRRERRRENQEKADVFIIHMCPRRRHSSTHAVYEHTYIHNYMKQVYEGICTYIHDYMKQVYEGINMKYTELREPAFKIGNVKENSAGLKHQ